MSAIPNPYRRPVAAKNLSLDIHISGEGHVVVGGVFGGFEQRKSLLGALKVRISGHGSVKAGTVRSLDVLIDGRDGKFLDHSVHVDSVSGNASARIPGDGVVRVFGTVRGDTTLDVSRDKSEPYSVRTAYAEVHRVLGRHGGSANTWGMSRRNGGGCGVSASATSPDVF